MTIQNDKMIICQKCGGLTPLHEGFCVVCGKKPLLGGSGVSGSRKAGSAPQANGEAADQREVDSLRQQIDFLLKENRIITDQLAGIEKDFWTAKAGFDILLDESTRGLRLDRKKFLDKWASHAKNIFKGLRIRELFYSKKWEIIGACAPGTAGAVESLMDEAEMHFGAQAWIEALSKLEAAHKLSPANASLTRMIAEFLVEFGRIKEAGPYIRKALKEERVSIDTLRLAAISDLAAGRNREALQHLDRWIEESGEPYEGLIVKACLKAESGKWTEAQKWSKKAAEKERAAFPLLLLAFSLIMQKKYGGAETTLETAVRSHPDDVEIKHMLHAVYLLKGVRCKASGVKTGLKNKKDRELCAKREKYLSANKVESFLKTIAPKFNEVLGELNLLGSVSFD